MDDGSGASSREAENPEDINALAAYLWAHNLALISALTLVVCGFFTILWANGKGYKCEINGERIAEDLIFNPNIATANAEARGYRDCEVCDGRDDQQCSCCWPSGPQSEVFLEGNVFTGLYAMLLGFALLVVENRGAWAQLCKAGLAAETRP